MDTPLREQACCLTWRACGHPGPPAEATVGVYVLKPDHFMPRGAAAVKEVVSHLQDIVFQMTQTVSVVWVNIFFIFFASVSLISLCCLISCIQEQQRKMQPNVCEGSQSPDA